MKKAVLVHFEEELYEALRTRSFEKHIPMAEIIRESVRKYLKK